MSYYTSQREGPEEPMMPEMPGQQMPPGSPVPSIPPRPPVSPAPPAPRPPAPRPPVTPRPPVPRPPVPPPVSDIRLINDIQAAVVREVHAYDYYTALAEMARNEQDRQTIFRIIQDEVRHYRWFSRILQRLGAQQPAIPPGEYPRSFEQGVRYAIRDELDAAAFYQNIAYRARERSIEMHFLHAAQDEQRHAAWFQFMLASPQPMPY